MFTRCELLIPKEGFIRGGNGKSSKIVAKERNTCRLEETLVDEHSNNIKMPGPKRSPAFMAFKSFTYPLVSQPLLCAVVMA